jgi:hypothetical protein
MELVSSDLRRMPRGHIGGGEIVVHKATAKDTFRRVL